MIFIHDLFIFPSSESLGIPDLPQTLPLPAAPVANAFINQGKPPVAGVLLPHGFLVAYTLSSPQTEALLKSLAIRNLPVLLVAC